MILVNNFIGFSCEDESYHGINYDKGNSFDD